MSAAEHTKEDTVVDLPMTDKICIRDLSVRNIIGVDAWERSKRQPIIINLVVYTSVSQAGDTDHLVSYFQLVRMYPS